nr:hypothetical protein CFP56_70944 [Quercus suber]
MLAPILFRRVSLWLQITDKMKARASLEHLLVSWNDLENHIHAQHSQHAIKDALRIFCLRLWQRCKLWNWL